MKRIIGIDCGIAATGYGVLDVQGATPRALAWGVVRTRVGYEHQERLAELAADVLSLLRLYSVDAMAIERIVAATMRHHAGEVLEARGVILYVAQVAGVKASAYYQQSWKREVIGNGRATKVDVQEEMQRLLGLDQLPRPDHAADALALAWMHYVTARLIGGAA